jgi:diguanylate cyclase (GGDEF)-like protein
MGTELHLDMNNLNIDGLRRFGMIDPLTGVGNRRAFQLVLGEAVQRALNTPASLSVFDLDIDYLKRINDNFGHLAGDGVLAEFTRLMLDTLNNQGFLFRTSGDGFTILLPNTESAKAIEIGERLRQTVANWCGRVSDWSGTVSIGAVTLDPKEPDLERLHNDARQALYRAKAGRRNCVSM